MTDRNENRPGYKKTKAGWIPSDWEICQLEEVAEIFFSNVDKKSYKNENEVMLCNYIDVYYNEYITKKINFMRATASDSEIKKFRLQHGDVIITKDSERRDDIAVSALVTEDLVNVICGYHLALIRPKTNRLLGVYLNKLYGLHVIRHYFATLANGVTRFGLTSKAVANSSIPLPLLPEQKKIAEILSTWGDAIEQTRQLIDAKKHHKKALMQQTLANEQRLGKQGWRVRTLGELVESVSRPVPKPNEPYMAIGIRSHGKGTFQKVVEKPEKVMMDTLYEVESHDLIVNITFAWEGAIAIANEKDTGGLVSHRFPTYHLKKGEANLKFFKHLILTERFVWDLGLISPGGAGRNRVMSKKDFLKLRVNVPSSIAQEEIGRLLTTMDDEIWLLEYSLKALKRQKRGLMQKLLTGQMRVKV